MALWQFSNLNKYGTLRKRIMYRPDGEAFSYNPRGLGRFVAVRRFKYTYEHTLIPPGLFTDQKGDKYIVPTWQKVHPETTLNDIEWVKPEKIEPKQEPETWKFKSSSSDVTYTVRKVGVNYKCNCPGFYRAFDRRCKHIKQVENEQR